MLLAPSILAADFGNLQKDIEMINQSDADWRMFASTAAEGSMSRNVICKGICISGTSLDE